MKAAPSSGIGQGLPDDRRAGSKSNDDARMAGDSGQSFFDTKLTWLNHF